jgi:protein gp37
VATNTRIEWTEATWNPTVGCTKVSPGCQNCYAEKMAQRLKAMGTPGYARGFELALLPNRLNTPKSIRRPTMFFVNSMSDLFHKDVPDEYIDRVLRVMGETPRHTYQVLTKRANRMRAYFATRVVPPNVWLGVSIEDRRRACSRLPVLQDTNAGVRFLSVEPLLEDLGDLDLTGIQWVIVGGESGPKARPMRQEWVEKIFKHCRRQRVAFFFKQWGAWGADGVRRSKKSNGSLFRGSPWQELPQAARDKRAPRVSE